MAFLAGHLQDICKVHPHMPKICGSYLSPEMVKKNSKVNKKESRAQKLHKLPTFNDLVLSLMY